MVVPAVKEQILNDLGKLSPEQQKQAAELVHRLLVPQLPPGVPGKDLLRFAGTMDDESAREIMEAVKEGCERVYLDEW